MVHMFDLCYTGIMQAGNSLWIEWARILQRFNFKQPAALLLEAAGPLSILLAQLVYIGQPLLDNVMPQGKWEEIAKMLDDHAERNAFAAFLREGDGNC